MSTAARLLTLSAIFIGLQPSYAQEAAGTPSPIELFEQRIMPIFKSAKPSSCVQCHLAAVDLKNYILPSQEKTFASLRDQGLVDLKNPSESKILKLIRMGDKDRDKGARLIHEKTRQAEYTAFAAWISACCNDPKLVSLPRLSKSERAAPKPDAVIRHARKSRVVDSFVRNVWSQRLRCFPCHTPHEIDPKNPRHKKGMERVREFQKQYGERMNIFRKTPEETLAYLIKASRNHQGDTYPMLNLEDPRKSLFLLKPMAKLPLRTGDKKFAKPSSIDPISHMGGLKIHKDDPGYKSVVAWLKDYANVVGDKYVDVKDLPADNWYPTKRVIKIARAPMKWPVGRPVQFHVYTWDKSKQAWSAEPVAFTQGVVTPRRRLFGALVLLRPSGVAPAKFKAKGQLPRTGKFLIKAFVDKKRLLEEQPTALLGTDSFYGKVELEIENWADGGPRGQLIAGDLFDIDQ